jgi:hypothetical protein
MAARVGAISERLRPRRIDLINHRRKVVKLLQQAGEEGFAYGENLVSGPETRYRSASPVGT